MKYTPVNGVLPVDGGVLVEQVPGDVGVGLHHDKARRCVLGQIAQRHVWTGVRHEHGLALKVGRPLSPALHHVGAQQHMTTDVPDLSRLDCVLRLVNGHVKQLKKRAVFAAPPVHVFV